MSKLRNRSPRWLALAAVVMALAMWGAPAAVDAPEDPGAVADSPTIGLVDMGTSTPLAFYGDQGTTTLTFPVPQGLISVALNATVEIPVNVRSGTLTLHDTGADVATLELEIPNDGDGQPNWRLYRVNEPVAEA